MFIFEAEKFKNPNNEKYSGVFDIVIYSEQLQIYQRLWL